MVLHEKTILGKLSIYMLYGKLERRLMQHLIALGENSDLSVNCLVVEAITQYVEREEDVQ